MELVLDTNIIISALIKKGITRKLLLNKNYIFYTPEYTKNEISKYTSLILKKSNLTKE
jgi:predicted nucleic acid-binding protein